MEDIKLLKSYVDAELKKGVTELSKPTIEMVRLIYKELKGRYLPVVTVSRSLGFIPAHTIFSYGNHLFWEIMILIVYMPKTGSLVQGLFIV